MKIKTKNLSYDAVCALPKEKRRKPRRPSLFFRALLKTAGAKDLKAVDFSFEKIGMERLSPKEPALFLMNHSSFIDLKIATSVLYPRPFNIVCTSDGFIGKAWLMRQLGCIPTKKFITDTALVRDMIHAVSEKRCSVLMYPEASYSFDGTATPLPDSVGKCVKLLGIPVVMMRTFGAFGRDPLYNNLQLRDIKVSLRMEYLLSAEDTANKSAEEINGIIFRQFTFDNFAWQRENNIRISEPFRADGLNRVLYKCPACGAEGQTEGKGIRLTCKACGKVWELTELGELKAEDGRDFFTHIPDWYEWERKCVREELLSDSYRLDVPVDIRMMVNTKALYNVGSGRLVHDKNGFVLTGCEGKLFYTHSPAASYSLYADYYWYELGDMICIGDRKALYYCFPKEGGDVVAKTRLATEELYKLSRKPSAR